MNRQIFVGARIPFLVIHAIQDAAYRIAARRQRLLHAHSILRRGDFARVRRAHGSDCVGVQDPVFEGIDAASLEVVLMQ
jgi:hypothetical protein